MASFDVVNYSLRPSKSIQRQIVFEGVRMLQSELDLDRLLYVGFGSIWFTDFVMAHKLLAIHDMISIESDDIGYLRAVFNSPYATVRIRHGTSSNVLPTLYAERSISERPWMVWLDYDYAFDESLRDDVRSLIENAPMNSILLITYDGGEAKYGKAADRPTRIRELFGDVVPDDLSKENCKDERMQQTLASLTVDFMKSVASDLARPGGFLPAFRVIYKDTAPMVTVGGLLPSRGGVRVASSVVSSENWPGFPAKSIIAPHLTIREAITLQSQLPGANPMSRAQIRSLGFDLEDEQIEAFERYYRQYPAFAQIVA
jgi:hypothetical protein